MNTTFPTPPGQLGVAARAQDVLEYLGRLEAWLGQRRAELDALDAQVVGTGRQAELTGDMALALSLWQAVRKRQGLILQTWDSGRVGPVELDRLSGLLWGRLEDADLQQGSSLAVSVPEAGRLCDALVAQLRTSLDTDPGAEQEQIRLRDLRAQAERLRDQAALEPAALAPAARAKVDRIAARIADLSDRKGRGADIGGLLGPLEIDAARLERDLIVTAAQRRESGELVASARALLAGLKSTEQEGRRTAAEVSAAVWPAPAVTVPSLDSLGPMPNTREALRAYLARLQEYQGSLAEATTVLAGATAGLQRARSLLEALRAKADALAVGDDPVFAAIAALVTDALDRPPVAVVVVDHLLAAATARLDQLGGGRR